MQKQIKLLTALKDKFEQKYNIERAKTAQLRKILEQSDKLIAALQNAQLRQVAAAAAEGSSTSALGPAKHTIYVVSEKAQPQLAKFIADTFASYTNNRLPRFAESISLSFDRLEAVRSSGTKMPNSVCIFLVTSDNEGRWALNFKERLNLYEKAKTMFSSVILGCAIPTNASDSTDIQLKAKQSSWENSIKMAIPLTCSPETALVYTDRQSFNQVIIKRAVMKLLQLLDTDKKYAL